jgi:hypothetical protein
MDPEPTPTGPKEPRQVNSYLRFGSFAFQLLAGIGFAGWLGYKLDQRLAFKFPVFLLLFSFAVFGGMLYQAYKNLRKD